MRGRRISNSEQQQTLTLQEAIDLALEHHNAGRLSDAEIIYQRILQADPKQPIALNLLGVIAHQKGEHDVAIGHITKSITLHPGYAEAHYNLGNALRKFGELEDAISSYQKAISLKPGYPEAHNNLGNTLRELGRPEQAVKSFLKALELQPGLPEIHNNLGLTFRDLGKVSDAIASYRQAIDIRPGYSEAHSNLGNILKALNKLNDAEASYRKALHFKPDFAVAHNNLGTVLHELGRLKEATTSYRTALKLKPDFAEAHSNTLFSMSYSPTITARDLLDEAQRWDTQHSHQKTLKKHLNPPESKRRLRIGFMSGDFRNHSVSYFLETILAELNEKQFQTFAYSTFGRDDEMTKRLQSIVPKWRKAVGTSDEQLVAKIMADRIDILVDLSGHTAHNRLSVFSQKPAPIQVTWLGYPGTTGVRAMDYILCDHLVLPEKEDAFFVEKPWRLPDTWFCFTPPAQDINVSVLPALRNGYISFISCNHLAKLSDETLKCWAGILKAIPNSNLLLKTAQLEGLSVQTEIRARFEAHGVKRRQLTLESISHDRAEHLRSYQKVDIALDPFPYPGGRTTAESTWMGVPVLALKGERFVSHIGESFLCNIGLASWIADTPEDYIKKTNTFAADLKGLAVLRKTLRNRLLKSPICDAHRFTRNLEAAFRGMWEKWCDEHNA